MLPVVFEAASEALLGVLLTYGSRRGSGGLRPSLIKSIVIGQFAEATSRDRDSLVNCAPASADSPTNKGSGKPEPLFANSLRQDGYLICAAPGRFSAPFGPASPASPARA